MDFLAGNTQAVQPAVFAQLKLNDLVPDTGHLHKTAHGPKLIVSPLTEGLTVKSWTFKI